LGENDLGPLFQVPEDPHYLWIVGCAVAVVAIGVLLVGLLRGRLPTLFVLPALLLPLAAYGIGFLHLAEQSKKVEFCGSCHEPMSPLVTSLREDGDTLSSLHYQYGRVPRATACYECHSGYGIWGEVDAKMAGIMHMVGTLTGNYELPIRAKHFDIDSCLGCHAHTASFREEEDHQDPEVQSDLLSGRISCAGECHDFAHPETALWGVAGPPDGGVR
jgi:cytochrome c nitrite reductase small subunit